MDWLVFGDPSVQAIVEALTCGRMHWIALGSMQDELLHVLGRGVAARYQPDLAFIQASWARWCHQVAAPAAPAVRLLCRDTDDQKFLDLALAHGAPWLITRDRDLLALAKRARTQGLSILTPLAWSKLAQATGT